MIRRRGRNRLYGVHQRRREGEKGHGEREGEEDGDREGRTYGMTIIKFFVPALTSVILDSMTLRKVYKNIL